MHNYIITKLICLYIVDNDFKKSRNIKLINKDFNKIILNETNYLQKIIFLNQFYIYYNQGQRQPSLRLDSTLL